MTECPVCGEFAHETMSVEMGDSWRDTAGKPPHSLFSTYHMLHVGGVDQDGALVVFCHRAQQDMI